jgi:hypothetical protein
MTKAATERVGHSSGLFSNRSILTLNLSSDPLAEYFLDWENKLSNESVTFMNGSASSTIDFQNYSSFNNAEKTTIANIHEPNQVCLRPIHVATVIVFLSGIFQILMGFFRLDFLSCYLSEQVLGGFVLGGCVHVMVIFK